jgi:hypothetical protein
MGAVNRDSTLYSNIHTNKYLADARHLGGRVVPLPFEVTIVSGATVGDSYNLTVIPANARVIGLECVTNGIGDSAGDGVGLKIGDSGVSDRYMADTDFDVAEARGTLAYAGQGYTPTADTIVVATITGGAAKVGQVFKGCLLVVPGA